MLEEAVEDLTRYPHIQSIDKSLSSNKYLNLIEDHSRHHSFILTQLRMGHSPLNQHLFRIHCSETPTCPHCQGVKTHSNYKGSRRLTRRNTGKGKGSLY